MKLIARDALTRDPMIALLGPEPLGNAFDGTMLAEACAAKKTSLKAALSDQRVVAGLGNIYVCEALHRAHLSPERIASTIAERQGGPNGARRRSPSRSARCSTMRSARAARRCAIIAAPTASSATSSTISASTIAPARNARRRAQGHDQAHRAGDAEHVLLSGVSAVALRHSPAGRATAKRLKDGSQTPLTGSFATRLRAPAGRGAGACHPFT